MKKCSKCGVKKHDNSFGKYKNGLQSYCKPCVTEYRKIYNKTEKHKKYMREYCQRPEVKKYRSSYHKIYIKKWQKDKITNDPLFRLSYILRKRLNMAVKRNTKTGSAIQDLGCTIPELKIHLENKFQKGMNWDNYGKWHIDHIAALANFNLSDRKQLLKAVNYKNLQPLWAVDNLSKNKY